MHVPKSKASRGLLLLATGCAGAAEWPRWELGAGLAVAHLPDYRSAGEGRAYALPVPSFVYRGERLRADRDGLRGELFETERVELNVSVGLGVPVRTNGNEARQGMRRLDPVVEAGRR
jgi:outer membrane protein